MGPPIDKLRLGNREAYPQEESSTLEGGVLGLQPVDVFAVGVRGGGESKVFNVGNGQPTRDVKVQAGHIDNK